MPDLREALATSIIEVADLHREECDVMSPAAPSATVAILRTSPTGEQVDYLVIADAIIAFETHDLQQEVISDNRVDEVAKSAQSAALEQSIGTDEHRQAIEHLIATQQPLRNTPGGYWIASADPTAAEHAITGSRKLDELKHAALMSDGASRVVDLFGLATWHDVFERLQESGPRSLIRTVRTQEQKDPTGEKWPRYKKSDDATIIYVRW